MYHDKSKDRKNKQNMFLHPHAPIFPPFCVRSAKRETSCGRFFKWFCPGERRQRYPRGSNWRRLTASCQHHVYSYLTSHGQNHSLPTVRRSSTFKQVILNFTEQIILPLVFTQLTSETGLQKLLVGVGFFPTFFILKYAVSFF